VSGDSFHAIKTTDPAMSRQQRANLAWANYSVQFVPSESFVVISLPPVSLVLSPIPLVAPPGLLVHRTLNKPYPSACLCTSLSFTLGNK